MDVEFEQKEIVIRPMRWVSFAAVALLSIVVCIAYVDRPLATFAHAQFADTRLFAVAGGVFRPSRVVLALVALALTLIVACLVITNSHWLADILGGFYLGTLTGVVAAKISASRTAAD